VLAGLVLVALGLWIGGGSVINATLVALLVVTAMLVLRVVSWEDILGYRAAWGTLAWFATLVAMAEGLNRTGFVAWVATVAGAALQGFAPGAVGLGLLTLFYFSRYLFASSTAHATALLPVVLVTASAVPGIDLRSFALQLCLTFGLMGIVSPYATGPSPIYYGSGYLPARDYWRLGGIFGAVFFAVFLAVGLPWMAWVR
jgi:L-tartrate/succinate antiporter